MDIFNKQKALKREMDAEKRERDFVREQSTLDILNRDDASYFHEQEGRVNLLLWQQDMDYDLQKLCYSLLGYRRFGDKWEKVDKPVCNMSFIKEVIMPICEPFLNKNTTNSNWSEKLILNQLGAASNEVSDAMSDGFDQYEINFTVYDTILRQIKTYITAAAYRSLNGWTKKIDSTMIKRIESLNEQQAQQQIKKGFWGLFQSG